MSTLPDTSDSDTHDFADAPSRDGQPAAADAGAPMPPEDQAAAPAGSAESASAAADDLRAIAGTRAATDATEARPAAPLPAAQTRAAKSASPRRTPREAPHASAREIRDSGHTGFPWEVSPLAHLSAAQIRAELDRRERRVAELLAEHARLRDALGRLESEIEDIEASLE